MVDIQNLVPFVVYDNACYLCVKFAKAVNFLAGGKILLVGHYTEFGEKIRKELLDSRATEMFWFIDGKTAFGGRAALIPLLSTILRSKGTKQVQHTILESCNSECKTPKAAFVRSASLFTNSRKIKITFQ